MGFVNAIAGPSRVLASARGGAAASLGLGLRRTAARAGPSFPLRRRRFGTAAPASSAPPSTAVEAATSSSSSVEAASQSLSAAIDTAAAAAGANGEAALGIIDTLSVHLLSSPLSAGATIILLTFLVRGAITFPVSLWQRKRVWRLREKVQPEMKRLNEQLAVSLARDMRRQGKDWDEYKRELKSQLAAHQLALHKRYGTHPLITMLTPLAVHVPILVTLSLTIRGALDASPAVLEALGHTLSNPIALPGAGMDLDTNVSPWAGQGFAWLPNLAEADPSVMLPIIGGVVAMINAETAGKKAKKVEGNEVQDGEVQSTTGAEAAQEDARVAQSRIATEPAGVSKPNRPRPAAASRLPRPTTARSATRPFSSSPTAALQPTFPATATAQRTYKKAPARYASPTVVQARERDRQAAAAAAAGAGGASGGKLTSITPEQELRKEKDKATMRQTFMATVLRGAAVIFVPFAAQVPAALALYWTTSMTFTMLQNLVLDQLEERRSRAATQVAAGRGKVPDASSSA